MSGRNKRKILFQEIHPDNGPILDLAVDIITKQLHNMPKDYVETLISSDCLHYNTLLMSDSNLRTRDKTIGCITFRLFPECNFSEIAFCCILTRHQGKGYGSELMRGLLDRLQLYEIRYAITYADKDSVGYFEKQGFEMGFNGHDIPRKVWYPRIFHYRGAHIMSIDREEIVLNITNVQKRIVPKSGRYDKTKHLFASCLNTESFQSQYDITAPPLVITDQKSKEYANITPSESTKLSPNSGWRGSLNDSLGLITSLSSDNKSKSVKCKNSKSKSRKRKNSKLLQSNHSNNSYSDSVNIPLLTPPSTFRPYKKRRLNTRSCSINTNSKNTRYRQSKSTSKLSINDSTSREEREGHYKIVDIEEFDILRTHYHATRHRLNKESNRDRSSLLIKLNYVHHEGRRYKLSYSKWQQITCCIEREVMRGSLNDTLGSTTEEIINSVSTIWHLYPKTVQHIMAHLDVKREGLYYPLPMTLKKGCCVVLPFNESDTPWDIQLFRFEFEDGFGHLWGHDLLQSPPQLLGGRPNLFGTFVVSNVKTNFIRKEEMKMFTKCFQLKSSKKNGSNKKRKKKDTIHYSLPDRILQELYEKNYPQFGYCFKSSNPLFRRFIFGAK